MVYKGIVLIKAWYEDSISRKCAISLRLDKIIIQMTFHRVAGHDNFSDKVIFFDFFSASTQNNIYRFTDNLLSFVYESIGYLVRSQPVEFRIWGLLLKRNKQNFWTVIVSKFLCLEVKVIFSPLLHSVSAKNLYKCCKSSFPEIVPFGTTN